MNIAGPACSLCWSAALAGALACASQTGVPAPVDAHAPVADRGAPETAADDAVAPDLDLAQPDDGDVWAGLVPDLPRACVGECPPEVTLVVRPDRVDVLGGGAWQPILARSVRTRVGQAWPCRPIGAVDGALTLRFDVAGSGRTTRPEVVTTTLDERLAACMRDAIGAWRFPPREDPAPVSATCSLRVTAAPGASDRPVS